MGQPDFPAPGKATHGNGWQGHALDGPVGWTHALEFIDSTYGYAHAPETMETP
jgi:hypothetical protein